MKHRRLTGWGYYRQLVQVLALVVESEENVSFELIE